MPSLRLPQPHYGQQIVLTQAKRTNVLSAGRRWRKTTLFMSIAVRAMAEHKTVVWGAPTTDQVKTGYEECLNALANLTGQIRAVESPQINITWKSRRMKGGILFRSLDNPDNARSKTADVVIIDEAADVDPVAWYEVLSPMLIDTHGTAWIGGTPKGHNWFYTEWENAALEENADCACWQAPTLGFAIRDGELVRQPHPLENTDIDWQEIVKQFRTMPERSFRQEFGAEFIADGGGVFRNVDALSTGIATPPVEGHTYVMGIDWGKVNDFTVLSVWDADERREVRLERFNQMDFSVQRRKIRELVREYNIVATLAERNSIGDPNIEDLLAGEDELNDNAPLAITTDMVDGIPIRGLTMTNKTKARLVNQLELACEKQNVILLNDRVATAELKAFTSNRTMSGNYQYAAPKGQHDDTVIARMLAYHFVTKYGAIPFLTERPQSKDLTKEEWDAKLLKECGVLLNGAEGRLAGISTGW